MCFWGFRNSNRKVKQVHGKDESSIECKDADSENLFAFNGNCNCNDIGKSNGKWTNLSHLGKISLYLEKSNRNFYRKRFQNKYPYISTKAKFLRMILDFFVFILKEKFLRFSHTPEKYIY